MKLHRWLLAGLGVVLTSGMINVPMASAEPGKASDADISALQKYYESRKNRAGQKPAQTPIPRTTKAHGKGDPHSALGPEKLVKVALQHIGEGRQVEALNTLSSGLQKFPDATKLRGIRGVLMLQSGQYADALKDFEAALNMTPNDVLLLVNRAQAYRQFGRRDEAMADLNKVLELKPDFVAALFNRGAIYLKEAKFEDARKDFEKCVAIDPHAAAPRFNLAMALDGLGRRPEAISEMEQFTKATKKDTWRDIGEKQLASWKKAGTTEKAEADTSTKTGGEPKAHP
ncbi:MAG: tetratricopeptide repeat protein [Filomicrobium sp.]